MEREGLVVSSQALWQTNELFAQHALPTYEAIGEEILRRDVVLADETWWRLLGSKQRVWAWHMAAAGFVYVWFHPRRTKEAAAEKLAGYQGVLVTDGYGVYPALQRAGPGMTLAHCWVHVRRKWIALEAAYEESKEVVELIGTMYGIERDLKAARAGPAEILEVRQERTRPIVDEIKARLVAIRTTGDTNMHGAIGYTFNRWKGLRVFLENPDVPLDTNDIERAIRGPAMGRRNFFGCKSERGLEVAAICYTLVQTALRHGIDPRAYLRAVALRAIEKPGTVTLPADFQEAQDRAVPAAATRGTGRGGSLHSIDHGWLMKFVEHRVADRRILRLIRKWLNAGVMEDGTRAVSAEGTPQGAVISPLLANIYLHYVLDLCSGPRRPSPWRVH